MSFLYSKGIQRLGSNDIDLESDEIYVCPVHVGSGAYVPSSTGDNSLADIPSDARVGTATALTGKTFADGVFDANNLVVPNSSSTLIHALVLYAKRGAVGESASYLIAYIDGSSNFPFDPAGASIPIYWSNGPSKIFRIRGTSS